MRNWFGSPRVPSRPAADGGDLQKKKRAGRPALYLGERESQDVTFSGEGSLLTVGPPGTGKSRGVAVWNLLNYPGSMLVTDPKGELAEWSAHIRERMDHRVAVLDPFGQTSYPSASVNPATGVLDAVNRGAGLRTEAERIAHLLLPDVSAERDPFWRQGGRRLITTGLLYLAVIKPKDCHLPGLYDVLWKANEAFSNEIIGPMRKNDDRPFSAALWQYAEDTASSMVAQERAFAVFREEARQALSIFAGDEPCGQACLRSDIDFSGLLSGNLTVYLVLPAEFVTSHGRWMGLVTSHAIHAIMKSREAGDCVFMLDEFPNLGPLPGIRDAVAQLRGKGLRVWLFVQDIAQLEAIYGKADALNLRAQAEVLQVLGCRSLELADFIEKRGGQKTVKVVSVGLPDPANANAGPHPNVAETGVPVFPAATVLEMPHGKQFLIRHGEPVTVADVRLWEGG